MSNNIPQFTIRQMLESGVHYGHKKNRWNPQMSQFIYGSKGDVHIIDLTKTHSLLQKALQVISNTAKNNGKILFIGTKRQLSATIATHAQKCNQYYVNHRWLGGMLTNWTTVSNSIKTLQNIENTLADKDSKTTKKEKLHLSRKQEKLNRSLGGIRELKGMPSLVIVFDTLKESNAIQEAKKLNIPIIAVVDTNSSLDSITYPIPGNDDSAKATAFFCNLISETISKSSGVSTDKIVKKEKTDIEKSEAKNDNDQSTSDIESKKDPETTKKETTGKKVEEKAESPAKAKTATKKAKEESPAKEKKSATKTTAKKKSTATKKTTTAKTTKKAEKSSNTEKKES